MSSKKGVLLGILCYTMWGFVALYWKAVKDVSAIEILCYRILWSFLLMSGYLLIAGKFGGFMTETKEVLRKPRTCLIVVCAALCISVNWFVYIYSVSTGHMTETSLGYYINPLLNVLLGVLFLKERLTPAGMIACALALTGVFWLVAETGAFPWQALALALSFGIYGLLKKQVHLSSVTSLTLEAALILPAALIYLLFFGEHGFMAFPLQTNLLLVGAGIVTAIPLLLFSEAAKEVSYITLGFIQYVSPTINLILALFVFHEPTTPARLQAFGLIWLGIFVFMWGNWRMYRAEKSFTAKE